MVGEVPISRFSLVFILLVCTFPAVLADGVPPLVTSLYPSGQTFNISDTISINATVTDSDGVDAVFANISYPNGTKEQLTLHNITANVYNVTVVVPRTIGQFNITIIANDTVGNVNQSEITNFISDLKNPTSLTRLRAWYDAADNSTLYTDTGCSTPVSSEGQEINCWGDKSDYLANATPVSGKGVPIFAPDQFNGRSVVNFSKSDNDTLRHTLDSQYTSDFTLFIVVQSQGTSPEQYDAFFSNGEPSGNDHFQIDFNGSTTFRLNGLGSGMFFETFNTDINLYGVTQDSGTSTAYSEGSAVNTASNTNGRVFEHYRINQNRQGNKHHNSFIGEIVIYDRALNACEIEKVNNYLGPKYGRDFSGIDDRYEYSSNFPHDINGVGIFLPSFCSPVPLLSSAISDSATITITAASAVDQNDTLTFGHDNGNLTVISEAPGTYSRIQQEWRVDIDDAVGGGDDGVGNVTVSFDLSTNTSILTYDNFVLLIDDDGDFSNAEINATGTVSGNTVSFSTIAFSNGDYFTLGFNDTTPPNVISPIPSAASNASTGTRIEIGANVTDAIGVDTVLANLTLPNGSKEQFTLTKNGNTYNTSYAVSITFGTFTVLFIANDTSGNINSSETTTFTTNFVDPTSLHGIQLWYDSTDNTTLYTDSACSTQVSTDYQEILCWEDKAGGDQNATVVSGKYGARYRSVSTEKINSLTTLRFNKSNETVYETGFDIRATTNENITSFSVYRPRSLNTSDQGQGLWGNDNGAWDRFFYSLFAQNGGLGTDGIDDGLISLGGASNGLSIDGAGIVDDIFLLTAVYNGNTTSGSNVGPPNGSQIYFDGVSQINFTDESHITAAQTQLFLGWDGDNGHYDGDYAETIVYSRLLTACEIELVNNYLGNKYGKDFNSISANYEFSAPYNNNINGIGVPQSLCDPASAITSAQSDVLTVSSATDAQEGDLVTFGHDDGNLTVITEAPSNYQRVRQEWRIDVDNTPGNVTLSFDLSDNTTLLGYDHFVLFVDSDGDFSDAVVINITGVKNGNIISFPNVSFSNGDYFTLGFNDTSVPSVFALVPEQGTNFTLLSTITISANVTDAIGVDTVMANITFPNTTSDYITLTKGTGNTYSTTYILSNHTGQYNITYHANDTTGNTNNSEKTFFTVLNFSAPGVQFVDPTPAFGTSSQDNFIVVNVSSSNTDGDHYTVVDHQEALFGWYRFDDVNASGDPTDLSTQGNNASLESGAFINGSGTFGNAVQFDGTNDYLLLPDNSISFAQGLSICVWVYWDSFDESWSRITDFGQGQADDNILFAHDGTSTDLVFEVYSGGSSGGKVTASSALIAQRWQHLCALVNASGNASIYVDGVNVQNGSTSVPAQVTRDQMYIARSAWGSDGYFDGAMDEFLLFNRTLQSSEIASIFNATATQYLTNFTGLDDANHSFVAYAVSSNGQKNQTAQRNIITDSTAPTVVVDSPVTGSVFNLDTRIEIGANVTDSIAVDTVLANVSLPNGTIRQLVLSNEAQNTYNTSFTETAVIGLYSVRFIANDTSGNLNTGETTSFTLINNKTPSIAFVSTPTPLNNSLVNNNYFLVNLSSNSFDSADHYAFVDFDNTLVLWTRFDDVNSSGDPGDISGNNNNGSLVGTAKINTTSKFGSALHLDGNSDYVVIPDDQTLKLGTGDFTYSVWFNSNEVPSATRQIFCKRVNSAGNYEVQLESGGEIRTWIGDANGSATNMDSGTIIAANTWYHAVISRGNGTLSLYVNGALENQTASVHNVTSSSNVFIGRDCPSGAEYFNGAIDDVLIFNRSFSAADARSLYNASLHQYQNNFTSLAEGNHTFTGYAVSTNGRKNQTEQRLVTIDTTPPSVFNAIPPTSSQFDFNTIGLTEIGVDVTDGVGIDAVLANITFPNSTKQQLTLSAATGNTYNASFNSTGVMGQYTVLFIANDTAGNSNASETIFFTLIDNRTSNIAFTSPTASNGSIINRNYVMVNVSSNSFEHHDHYAFADFDDRLTLWMRFDDVNSSGDPTDISTKGHNGSLAGNALINKSGKFGNAVQLDGSGDYVDTTIESNLLATNSTISAWINLDTLSQDDSRIVADDDNDQGWALSYGDSSVEQRIRFFIRGMDTVSLDADSVITQPNVWYHVVVILDRTNNARYIYVNGTLNASLASDTGSPSTDAGSVTIGSESSASAEADTDLDGAIDDVLIFNRSLSATEVQSLYNASRFQYQNNFTSLADGNHTFIGYAVSTNGQKNQTEQRTITIDTTPPSVTNLVPAITSTFNLDTRIEVGAEVTDNLPIGIVLVNITFPNGTVEQFTMGNASQTTYNISFNTTSAIGQYTVRIIANDTIGNVNRDETTSFFVINNKTPSIAFVSTPTPLNNTLLAQTHFLVNISSNSFISEDHYTFIDFDDRLTLWMRFDDVNGSGDPTDISTKGNNGSLSGDALINATGRFGDALHVDGNGDFVNLPASNVLIPNGDVSWTMSTWFNAKHIGSSDFANRIITVRNGPGLSAISFTLGQNDQIQFFYRDGGGSGTTTDIRTISTDTWYHYVVSYTGSQFLVYVNGELNATITDSMASTSSDTARIGANPSGSSEFFNGSIDDILLFDRSLSATDVRSLYNASFYQYQNNFTSLAQGNHTFTGYAVSTNGKRNQTETRTVTIDTFPPNVTALIPVQDTSFNENTRIEIAANVTDAVSVHTVQANVSYPNGTIETLTLSNADEHKYNVSFTLPSLSGTFTVSFFANDSVNNVNQSEQTRFIGTETFSPGGISPELTLWLDAGKNDTVHEDSCGGTSSSHGDVVSCWQDRSVNSNDVISSGTERPTFQSNSSKQINFNPALDFDGSNDFLEDADGESYINGVSEFSTFVVADANAAASDGYIFNAESGTQAESPWGLRFDSAGALSTRDNTLKTGINTGTPQLYEGNEDNIASADPMLASVHWTSGEAPTLFVNGRNIPLHTTTTKTGTLTSADYVRVGHEANQQFWSGGIAELIYYQDRLNFTAQYKVASYLAIKYGLTLDSSLNYVDSENTTIYASQTTHENFTNDIAGIGVDRTSELNQTRSQSVNSDSVVQMRNASSLDDRDFLIWGNDNASMSEQSSNFPLGIATRLQRVWRVDKTGDAGTVTVVFNLSGVSVTGTTAPDFTLLIDSDTNFSVGATTVTASSFSDSVARFESISFSDDQFFTLATSNDTTPPTVTAVVASPTPTFNLTARIDINATIQDLSGVNTTLLNITLPDNSVQQVTMSHLINNIYNASYVLSSMIGTYTVRIIANDTLDNVNSSVTTTFELQNGVPQASGVAINGGNDVTLTQGTNTTLIGTATITDANGFGHITGMTGYFSLTTADIISTDNKSSQYTVVCSSNGDENTNTVSYNCTFNVSHYAVPTDSSANLSITNWTFTAVPSDSVGIGTNGTDVVEMNTLLAFTINPNSINFGELALGTNTTTTNQEINVTNRGNVGLDVVLSGTNLSCGNGLVPVDFLEYEDNPFQYGVGTDLLESGVELDLDATEGYEGNETPLRITYYGLKVPGISVGGGCSGTITITGQADPGKD